MLETRIVHLNPHEAKEVKLDNTYLEDAQAKAADKFDQIKEDAQDKFDTVKETVEEKKEEAAEAIEEKQAEAEAKAEEALDDDHKLTYQEVFNEEHEKVSKHTFLKVIAILILLLIILEVVAILIRRFAPDSAAGVQIQNIYEMLFSRFTGQ